MAAPRVLCCGDSLTAGMVPNEANAPYARTLSETLGVPVDEIGVVGTRADAMLKDAEGDRGILTHLRRTRYTVVIIMVGTNDLSYTHPADQILADVQKLHGLCHRRGVRTIALPIPPSQYTSGNGIPRIVKHWGVFNKALEEWAATLPGKMLFINTNPAIPFSTASGDWCPDGLHMSPQGYAKLGRHLGRKAADFVLHGPQSIPAETVEMPSFLQIKTQAVAVSKPPIQPIHVQSLPLEQQSSIHQIYVQPLILEKPKTQIQVGGPEKPAIHQSKAKTVTLEMSPQLFPEKPPMHQMQPLEQHSIHQIYVRPVISDKPAFPQIHVQAVTLEKSPIHQIHVQPVTLETRPFPKIQMQSVTLEKTPIHQFQVQAMTLEEPPSNQLHIKAVTLEKPPFSQFQFQSMALEKPQTHDFQVHAVTSEQPLLPQLHVPPVMLEKPTFHQLHVKPITIEKPDFPQIRVEPVTLEKPPVHQFHFQSMALETPSVHKFQVQAVTLEQPPIEQPYIKPMTVEKPLIQQFQVQAGTQERPSTHQIHVQPMTPEKPSIPQFQVQSMTLEKPPIHECHFQEGIPIPGTPVTFQKPTGEAVSAVVISPVGSDRVLVRYRVGTSTDVTSSASIHSLFPIHSRCGLSAHRG